VVIATVGSEAKAARVRELGADHVILYREQDVAAEVRRITDGRGVPVAYDSVGKDTFEGTLKSLARRGLFVSFGNASGPPPPIEARQLMLNGSLFFTRPTMGDYQATTAELDASAKALFDMIGSGKIAMSLSFLWYTCCFDNAGDTWDIAAVPSYKGKTTASDVRMRAASAARTVGREFGVIAVGVDGWSLMGLKKVTSASPE